MKVYIRQNATTKTGYEIVSINDDGQEICQAIENTVLEKKTNVNWLVLPENAANRKLINPAKLEKANGFIELTYKESKVLGPRENASPRKKLEDYLTDEEKAIIADIMEKAKERREADKPKPLTPVEKAKRELERAQAKLDELMRAQA